jgi:hypothetical protein
VQNRPSGDGNTQGIRAGVARSTAPTQFAALTLLEGLLELGELGEVGELARTHNTEARRQHGTPQQPSESRGSSQDRTARTHGDVVPTNQTLLPKDVRPETG